MSVSTSSYFGTGTTLMLQPKIGGGAKSNVQCPKYWNTLCCLHPFNSASASQGDWCGFTTYVGISFGEMARWKVWGISGHGSTEAWVSPQELPSKCPYCRRAVEIIFVDGVVVLSCLENMRSPHFQRDWFLEVQDA